MIIFLYNRLRVSAGWLGKLSLLKLVYSNVKASAKCPRNTDLSMDISLEDGGRIPVIVRPTIRHEIRKSVPMTAARR